MSRPDESAQTSTKLVLPSGQRLNLGLQGGNFVALVAILFSATSWANDFLRRVDAANEAVVALSERMDKIDSAIGNLAKNSEQIERLSGEIAEVRATNVRLATEIAAVSACARDKRKC